MADKKVVEFERRTTMADEKVVEKPTLVARAEFTQKLVDLINNSGVPLFVLEPVIDGVAAQVKQAVAAEIAKEQEAYKNKLEEAGVEDKSKE